MTTIEVMQHLKNALDKGEIIVDVNEGYRFYTDAATKTLNVPITSKEDTLKAYKKLVIDAQNKQVTTSQFDLLPRVSMFIGQPDTGKTYFAQQIAEQTGVKSLFKMCRDSLNLETLLEDFTLVDGKPVFQESLAIKYLSGTEPALIILDEFNTLLTGVMKTLQPVFDDTSKTFEYRGKIYQKNMKCKFIVTLNDKDKGISIVPDAILSRAHLKYFDPVSVSTIAKWTGVPVEWVQNLQKIYKLLGILNVFGTRQIKMLYNSDDPNHIKNHLYGLCVMKNIDPKILNTLQTQDLINKL